MLDLSGGKGHLSLYSSSLSPSTVQCSGLLSLASASGNLAVQNYAKYKYHYDGKLMVLREVARNQLPLDLPECEEKSSGEKLQMMLAQNTVRRCGWS